MKEEKTMSEKITEKVTKTEQTDDMVWYEAPLLPGMGNMDVVAGVNGKLIRLKRGERVQIHRKYVEVLDNAVRQQNAAFRSATEAQKPKKLLDL
jgi:hypothetical protein